MCAKKQVPFKDEQYKVVVLLCLFLCVTSFLSVSGYLSEGFREKGRKWVTGSGVNGNLTKCNHGPTSRESSITYMIPWAMEGETQDHICVIMILNSDEAHFWLNGYVNKQNCRNWSEANPQVYVETPLHPEKLTIWCALWAGGTLLQKR
ncbi:hypothetical protein TNCV_919351 [Trichonephila clavipes]|nr:hypothetical protein TNCV_919351 [Trichonephila clavipes]